MFREIKTRIGKGMKAKEEGGQVEEGKPGGDERKKLRKCLGR